VKPDDPHVEDRLRAFVALLRERAVPLGLVGEADAERIEERHVEDSLRALTCLTDATSVADVGSGAGLPGIPVAIARSDVAVALIEPRRRRAAFLELCIEALGLDNARVVATRSSGAHVRVDLCLTRALGDAVRSWQLSEPVLRPFGTMVYFAGRSWSDEDRRTVDRLGLSANICVPASFPWQGPLVKIGRKRPDRPAGWRH
jgi:16S rRNA (guanine527-N7)-methyltransferase